MKKPFISYFYGVHPSKCFGYVVNIDPVLPPRKCPLNCFHCVLPGGEVVPRDYSVKIDLVHFHTVLEENRDVLLGIPRVRLWGFGDPLLVENIYDVARYIRTYIENHGGSSKVLLHSSGVTLGRALKTGIVNAVDELSVSFPWCSGDPEHMGLPSHITLGGLIDSLKLFPSKDKLVLELLVVKLRNHVYPDPLSLEELASCLSRTGAWRIRVRTLHRPPANEELKPVSSSILKTIGDRLIREGFEVLTCNMELTRLSGVEFTNLQKVVYNHLLRQPLSTNEILMTYGEDGLIVVDNMVSKQWVARRVWENKVFYRATY